MNLNKLILMHIVLFAIAQDVIAFRIEPELIEINTKLDIRRDFSLKLINDKHREVRLLAFAEGELAPYVEFETPSFVIYEHEAEKKIRFRIDLPDLDQGIHTTKLNIIKVPSSVGVPITALAKEDFASSYLKVIVPVSGKHVNADVFIPEVRSGFPANITVKVLNTGDKRIRSATVTVDIYKNLTKFDSVSSNKKSVGIGATQVFRLAWTPNLDSGVYRAVATISYDGLKEVVEKEFVVTGKAVVEKPAKHHRSNSFLLVMLVSVALAVYVIWRYFIRYESS